MAVPEHGVAGSRYGEANDQTLMTIGYPTSSALLCCSTVDKFGESVLGMCSY